MNLSEKLKIIRKSKGITQESLASKLSVSRQAVAKWESGMAYPDIINLIQLSELFNITIDYLVKDNECEKSISSTADTNKNDLVLFKMEAIKNTYAGYANTCSSSRPASNDYQYKKGDYLYYDTWLGGEKFSGEEAIWEDDIPVYSMNYFGRTLDERFSGDFLKEALGLATIELPYRGPEFYESGEYTYKTKAIGNIDWFQGYEEILWHNEKVYECFYHGGTLV